MTAPRARYLSDAASAGLLGNVNGKSYVAGELTHPASGDRQCFVEYADPELLTGTGLPELTQALTGSFPGAVALLLRADQEEFAAPWERLTTYLRYADVSPPFPNGVTHASAEQDRDVAGWLGRAFRNGAGAHGYTPTPDAVNQAVRELMSRPDRRSYVAVEGDQALGHVTLLCDEWDDLTGQSIVELVDVLEEVGDRNRKATPRLVASAISVAAELGRPLIGSVIHYKGHGDTQTEHGQRVVSALLGRGWVVDHCLWGRDVRVAGSGTHTSAGPT